MDEKHQWFCKVLSDEAQAISNIRDRLDANTVVEAVELVASCAGKVLLLGVGKSGLIGRKIAATLTSTGTTALFVHACDAIHGDLGVLGPSDIVIMISYSGETDELVALLPHMARRQTPILAITGNLQSTLARAAAVVLDAGVSHEACHLNLAPTASSTAALAIGDALAMVVARVKGLTKESFALNHPAGRLGKRLTLRVADLMQAGPNNPVIGPDAGWQAIILAISSFRVGAVSVIDHDCRLLGIITDGDLRRVMSRTDIADLGRVRAATVMTQKPRHVLTGDLAYDALTRMKEGELGVSVLPVLDAEEKVIGMLRLQDLVRSGI
jgi:arabinose-5-phosphate isomerase